MLVTRWSPISKVQHTLDLPIEDQDLARYAAGALIQEAFPNLSPAQREFIMSGITPEEWLAAFPPDEDEE